jgi:hypothetical protein
LAIKNKYYIKYFIIKYNINIIEIIDNKIILNLMIYIKNIYKISRIITHDGKFHTDEVFGCMMLKNYTKKYKDCEVIRTRNLDQLTINEKDDILIDIGKEFN